MVLTVLPGSLPLEEITNADLQAFISRRRSEVSNATANRQLQFMGRAIKHMARVYGATVAELDFKGAETSEPKERIRELSDDEQDRLFANLRPDFHPFVQFALMTGARKATIRDLQWRDIHSDRMVFRLKGGDTMRFPINAEIKALLSSLPRANSFPAAKYVFTFVDQMSLERKRFVSGGFHGPWLEAIKAAEIEDFRFHDCRHTFATRMLRHCRDLKTVSMLMGHKSIETTVRYAHVLDDDLANAVAAFSSKSRNNSRNTNLKA